MDDSFVYSINILHTLSQSSLQPYEVSVFSVLQIRKLELTGQMWWLMPVIPELWEAEMGYHLRSGVQGQPGQHGEARLY